MKKPSLVLQPSTLWEYPSQHYGDKMQGSQLYRGATPSYVIWNLLTRYTRENDLVVDPMCGSGTTIDVCGDLNRRVSGFDLTPFREDIEKADARNLPLKNGVADFVFVDPPYSDHIHYSEEPNCIGNLPAEEPQYFQEMGRVITEIDRILKPGRYMALYICDSYKKKKGFVPIGYRLYETLCRHFKPADIISVVRHNKTLLKSNWKKTAIEGNFFLRGFNYLFIMKKEK